MDLYGGIERHLCLLASLCASRNWRVQLMTTSNSLNSPAREELRREGVSFLEYPAARGKASKAAKAFWLLRNALRLRSTKWDVIYTNGQSGLAPLVWLAASSGTRIIHHYHTSGDAEERAGWHWSFRKAMALAPEIVACSEFTQNEIEKCLGRKRVIHLTYLTPPLLAAPEIADKCHTPNGELHLGYIGRIISGKGIDILCRLSDELSGHHLCWHIYGQGSEYPPEFFSRYPSVTYHGPYKDMAHYALVLRGLDAVVLYSRHSEGMPISLIEAMSAGLPWIATDRGGTSELAVSKSDSFIVPREADFAEVKRLTLELISRIRCNTTSRFAQRRVYDEKLSPDRVGTAWINYLSLAKRPSRTELPISLHAKVGPTKD